MAGVRTLRELRRRRVLRVATGYAVVGSQLEQVADPRCKSFFETNAAGWQP